MELSWKKKIEKKSAKWASETKRSCERRGKKNKKPCLEGQACIPCKGRWKVRERRPMKQKAEGRARPEAEPPRKGVMGCGRICEGLVSLEFIFHKLYSRPRWHIGRSSRLSGFPSLRHSHNEHSNEPVGSGRPQNFSKRWECPRGVAPTFGPQNQAQKKF